MNKQDKILKLIIIALSVISFFALAFLILGRLSQAPITTEKKAQTITETPSPSCKLKDGFCLWIGPDWQSSEQNGIKFHVKAPGIDVTEGLNTPPDKIKRLQSNECPSGYTPSANETCYQIKFDYIENEENKCSVDLLWTNDDSEKKCDWKDISCPPSTPSPSASPSPSPFISVSPTISSPTPSTIFLNTPTPVLTNTPTPLPDQCPLEETELFKNEVEIEILCPACACTADFQCASNFYCKEKYGVDFICAEFLNLARTEESRECVRQSAQQFCANKRNKIIK